MVHDTGFVYQLLGPDTFVFLSDGSISAEKMTLTEQIDSGWAN